MAGRRLHRARHAWRLVVHRSLYGERIGTQPVRGYLPKQPSWSPARTGDSRMMRPSLHPLLALALLLPLAGGGVSRRPPPVAHVHIGHAITGVHVTPNKEGYLVSAERRAQETIDFTSKAASSHDLAEIKGNIALASQATDSQDNFGVKESIVMAVNHVTFAATSDDATLNVQKSAPQFAADSTRVIERCDLIALLGKDVQASTSVKEASVSVAEIAKLAKANLSRDDSNGDGVAVSVRRGAV